MSTEKPQNKTTVKSNDKSTEKSAARLIVSAPVHPDKTPVAQEVKTYCTREKTDTFHLVMNHDRLGFVDRVKCKACGSEHKYKRQSVLKKPAAAPPRTIMVRTAAGALTPQAKVEKKGAGALLEEEWFQKIKKWGAKPVKEFSVDEHFTVGEVLNHSVFGKGVVQTRRENKVDVLFQAGLKTLPSKILAS
jgi:hypothetical protein